MLELVQHNPFVSLIALLIPIIAGTWKLFDALYVKPRDFRIAVLEKNLDEIKREIQSRPDASGKDGGTSRSDAVGGDSSSEETRAPPDGATALQQTVHLNNMAKFFAAWKDKSLTDLQRSHFEKCYVGQKIVWGARLQSVKEEADGRLWAGLTSESDQDSGVHIIAAFEPKHKEALLMIRKNETVVVAGTVDSFYLSPMIKDCTIRRGSLI